MTPCSLLTWHNVATLVLVTAGHMWSQTWSRLTACWNCCFQHERADCCEAGTARRCQSESQFTFCEQHCNCNHTKGAVHVIAWCAGWQCTLRFKCEGFVTWFSPSLHRSRGLLCVSLCHVLVACSSVWLCPTVQCLLLTTNIEGLVISTVVGSPISVPFHCTLHLLCPSIKHKCSPLQLQLLVLDLICMILFSLINKQQSIQKAGISTQAKSKMQNSPGSHAWITCDIMLLLCDQFGSALWNVHLHVDLHCSGMYPSFGELFCVWCTALMSAPQLLLYSVDFHVMCCWHCALEVNIWGIVVWFPAWAGFSFSKALTLVLGPHPTSYSMDTMVSWLGYDGDLWSAPSAYVENEWSSTSTPPSAFMASTEMTVSFITVKTEHDEQTTLNTV